MPIEIEAQQPATEVIETPVEGVQTQEAVGEQKPTSMEDTIRNAYRASLKQEAPDKTVIGKPRDPTGKFIKTTEQAEAEAVEGEAAEVTEQVEPVAKVEAKPTDLAPNTWKKEAAAVFAKLPEEAKQEIHRREQNFHAGLNQYKEAATFGQSIASELLPFRDTIQQLGVDPKTIVRDMGQAWHTLVKGSPEQKAGVMLQIAKTYGIDIASLGTVQQQDPAAQVNDPRLSEALQQIQQIRTHLTSQERQRADAEYQSQIDVVNKFGSNASNEHFNLVREDMAALIESGRATDLQDAYDKAIWANPEVRAKLLEKQNQQLAQKQAAEAAAARKAAGANVVKRGALPTPTKPGTIEDTIRAEYRRLNGAA